MLYSTFRSIAKPISLSLGCALLAACVSDESAAKPLADGPDAASTADAASQPGSDAGPGVDASTGSTIAGKVVWQYANVAGAKIVIGNKSATTDDKGAFAIADVALPYDLHVILPSEIRGAPPETTACTRHTSRRTATAARNSGSSPPARRSPSPSASASSDRTAAEPHEGRATISTVLPQTSCGRSGSARRTASLASCHQPIVTTTLPFARPFSR